MIFNERIKQFRKEKKLTRGQAAAAGGMVLRAYQRLENEEAKPHYDGLLNLANFFDVSADDLVGRTAGREVHQL